MKKSLKVVGLVLAIILSVGCMDMKVNMSVNSDKSVDVTMSSKIDLVKYMEVIYSMMGETTMSEAEIKAYLKENSDEIDTSEFLDEENKKKLEDAGYTVTANMDKENFIYSIEIKQHFVNIDSISSTEEQTTNLGDLFSGETNNIFFIKTANDTYKANLVADETDATDEDISLEEMEEYITFNYEITLPNTPISNNADSVSSDGKTLTWNLMSKDAINFEFAFPKTEAKTGTTNNNSDSNKTLAIGLIAGGSITLIVTLVAYAISKKKSA